MGKPPVGIAISNTVGTGFKDPLFKGDLGGSPLSMRLDYDFSDIL